MHKQCTIKHSNPGWHDTQMCWKGKKSKGCVFCLFLSRCFHILESCLYPSEVSQHFLSFVGSTNLSISSPISSLICLICILWFHPFSGLFTGLNLHCRHQSTPRHPLQVACSNDSKRLSVPWWGYTHCILWTVYKNLSHSLPVFARCPVSWTFANQFHIPNLSPHVWLWFRQQEGCWDLWCH